MFLRITFFQMLLFMACLAHYSHGQNAADTLVIEGTSVKVKGKIKKEIPIVIDSLDMRPNTAALYSAALPGLGQAYNKQYWKIPILYGGGLVIGYYMNYNHKLYVQYRDGIIAIKDGDDRTTPFNPRLQLRDYERQAEYWRRNRDLLFISAILIYVLNIVDAHVDAHLELFTIDDDISLRVEPSINQTAMQTNVVGLSLKLKF